MSRYTEELRRRREEALRQQVEEKRLAREAEQRKERQLQALLHLPRRLRAVLAYQARRRPRMP